MSCILAASLKRQILQDVSKSQRFTKNILISDKTDSKFVLYQRTLRAQADKQIFLFKQNKELNGLHSIQGN